MRSLRWRLFLLVAAATVLVWSLAAGWTVLSARADVERVLDRRLQEAAVMVASLGFADRPTEAVLADPSPLPIPTYERQLSCQVWSLSGRLLGLSESAPAQALSSGKPGFSEPVIDGTAWRVYTYVDPESGVRVMVGDTQVMRRRLIANLLKGLIIPAMAGLAALAALLWIGLGSGLAPVRRIAFAIAAREPDDQRPLDVDDVPQELLPLTQEIDELFARIARLREGEKRFLASAAHEMQTPLAGLRMHADLALRAPDEETRQRALERIRQSVDRTARLVRQLLDLSRQESGRAPQPANSLLGPAVDIVSEELAHLLERRGITLDLSEEARELAVPIDQEALILALRNLIENAALHGPENSRVTIGRDGGGFFVADEGSGIAPEDVEAMLEPFARGNDTGLPGSGLGLAIAASALAPDMELEFDRTADGFRVRARTVMPSD